MLGATCFCSEWQARSSFRRPRIANGPLFQWRSSEPEPRLPSLGASHPVRRRRVCQNSSESDSEPEQLIRVRHPRACRVIVSLSHTRAAPGPRPADRNTGPSTPGPRARAGRAGQIIISEYIQKQDSLISINMATANTCVIRSQYNPSDNTRNLFRIRQSIFPRAIHCSEFWIGLALHYTLYFLFYFSTCPSSEATAATNTTTCSSVRTFYQRNTVNLADTAALINLVVFFLIFYTNTCYDRFTTLYRIVCSAGGQLHGASLFMRDYFDDPVSQWQVMRYMLASHRIFFYLIKLRYAEWYGYTEESPLHPGSWDRFASSDLLPDGLLLSDEVDFLRVNACTLRTPTSCPHPARC
jgi:hypothetical protein